jgi:hypothetical protein
LSAICANFCNFYAVFIASIVIMIVRKTMAKFPPPRAARRLFVEL